MDIELSQLKELCIRYDKEYGHWPESEYEGWSVWEFICEELDRDPGLSWEDQLNMEH